MFFIPLWLPPLPLFLSLIAPKGISRQVHIRDWFCNNHLFAAQTRVGAYRPALALVEACAEQSGKPVGDEKAHVVKGVGVLPVGIAQTDYKIHFVFLPIF